MHINRAEGASENFGFQHSIGAKIAPKARENFGFQYSIGAKIAP